MTIAGWPVHLHPSASSPDWALGLENASEGQETTQLAAWAGGP